MGKKPKNKQTKTVLLFDDQERRDYLRGFKKRKDERRLKAQEEKKLKLREEKRIEKEKEKNMLLEVAKLSEKDEERLQHLLPKDDQTEKPEAETELIPESETVMANQDLVLPVMFKKDKKKAIKMIRAKLKTKSKKKKGGHRNRKRK